MLLPLPRDKRLIPLLAMPEKLPPELQVLERQIGASGRTISRIFQRETGMSYQQWRQQWRLMRAMELLATGRDLSYSAFELGFASDSAFIAFFKDMTGITLGAWLKQIDDRQGKTIVSEYYLRHITTVIRHRSSQVFLYDQHAQP